MPKKTLFILDPPDQLVPETDTSLALMRECARRHWEVLVCRAQDLHLENRTLKATVQPVRFPAGSLLYEAQSERQEVLSRLDVLWFRKDPPFDPLYFQATLLLDFLPPSVLQVNPASVLRNHCEKLIPLHFSAYCPDTRLSVEPKFLEGDSSQENARVLKPMDDCSGRGVFILRNADANRRSILAQMMLPVQRYLLSQEYLPGILNGETRVLLLDGEILGAIRRLPAEGDFRSNINAGGSVAQAELKAEERAVCAEVGSWLRNRGVFLAGIDLVEGKLLEVNITSPSCLMEMNELGATKLEVLVIDRLEELLAARRSKG